MRKGPAIPALLFLFVMAPFPSFAQVKVEQESRLQEEEVPDKALTAVRSLPYDGKVKWYREQGLDRTSVEAKFRMHDRRYSLEFDEDGNLEDIEIEVIWKELAKAARDTMNVQFRQDCGKLAIKKVQVQYTGEPSVLLSDPELGDRVAGRTTRYEVVVRCRKEDGPGLYEYLFSDGGGLLSIARIADGNSSHLEY